MPNNKCPHAGEKALTTVRTNPQHAALRKNNFSYLPSNFTLRQISLSSFKACDKIQDVRLSPLKYFAEVRSELTKVIWPKKGEVIKLTLLVILISVLIGGYVGGLDLAFTKLLSVVLTK